MNASTLVEVERQPLEPSRSHERKSCSSKRDKRKEMKDVNQEGNGGGFLQTGQREDSKERDQNDGENYLVVKDNLR